jgi:hypothetical protein
MAKLKMRLSAHDKAQAILPEFGSEILSFVQTGADIQYPGLQQNRFSTFGEDSQAVLCELLSSGQIKITKADKDKDSKWILQSIVVPMTNIACYQVVPASDSDEWNGLVSHDKKKDNSNEKIDDV